MGKSKFNLAIAQNIAAQTRKVKQIQSKSNYKYFQNPSLNNQKSDIFVKSGNFTQEITDRIVSNIQNSK